MTGRTAARLARYAKGRQRNDFLGWLARMAWRGLVRAADRGDRDAVDTLWRSWKQDQAMDTLECLTRWWSSPPLRDLVLRYAVDPAVPTGSRAVLGAFCAGHGLVPDDPVDRVRFFVLTGQPDEHRALDPDGTLLPIAYRAADQRTRTALREAMTGAGDLDVVGVIAGSGEPTGDELAYLTRHLAGTGQWPALWRLVRDLTLPDAVAAMDLFRGWEPHNPDERGVFARLAATSPDTMAAATRILEDYRVTPIKAAAATVAFAPDRSELAVALTAGGIRRYALPGPTFLHEIGFDLMRTNRVLYLGESIVAAQHSAAGPDRLVRYAGDHSTVVWTGESQHDRVWSLTGAGDRFFAAKSGELLAGTATTLRRISRYELGLVAVFAFPVVLATEPVSGQLAVGGRRVLDLSILDESLRVIAHRRDETAAGVRDVIFAGPDRLVTVDVHGWLMRWHRDGNTLRVDHSTQVPVGEVPPTDEPAYVTDAIDTGPHLCVLPARGRLVVARFGEVAWLDADTFAPADPPPGPGEEIRRLWSSADGHSLVVKYRNGLVELHDLQLGDLADLMTRPISSMTPAHLATVRAVRRRHLAPEMATALALLRACLAHRFDAEISLGTTTTPWGTEDDIALGGAR